MNIANRIQEVMMSGNEGVPFVPLYDGGTNALTGETARVSAANGTTWEVTAYNSGDARLDTTVNGRRVSVNVLGEASFAGVTQSGVTTLMDVDANQARNLGRKIQQAAADGVLTSAEIRDIGSLASQTLATGTNERTVRTPNS